MNSTASAAITMPMTRVTMCTLPSPTRAINLPPRCSVTSMTPYTSATARPSAPRRRMSPLALEVSSGIDAMAPGPDMFGIVKGKISSTAHFTAGLRSFVGEDGVPTVELTCDPDR